ncbi:MAG: glycoside hydrolase family 25 domain-containing protein [Ktedonobacteraceae bacterium]
MDKRAFPSSAHKKQADFIISSFRLDKNGLFPVGTPSLAEWVECGRFIKDAEKSVQFWIGDWLLYGEKHFGKVQYEQAILETGLDYQTLRLYKSVAGRVPPPERRETLSFYHHKEVADLPLEKRSELLT